MGQCVMKKTLLLGNGINLLFEGESWKQLLIDISGDPHFSSELPMPLRVVLATNNHVDEGVKRIGEGMRGTVIKEEHRSILREILAYGFNDIITTNYSYELEIASTEKCAISNYALDKMRNTTQERKRVETRYLIHTYNEVTYNNHSNRIWHIHGEARNPSGMVLGHYYYGNLLARIKEYVKLLDNRYLNSEMLGEEPEIKSWIDSFILNEIYVLGFGFDFSEMDLWWLLERKNREKACHGRVHFFCPEWEMDIGEKVKLLKSYGVDVHGSEINVCDNDYASYYKAALSIIGNL